MLRIALAIALLATCGCKKPAPISVAQMLSGRTMGTSYTIKVVPEDGMPALTQIAKKVQAELDEVNQQMSTYLPTSELSEFNAQSSTDWFAVSMETAAVVQTAYTVSEKTAGAFDVTVGPLVNLWGFGPTGRPEKVPSQEQIDEALSRVGYQKLEVRNTPPAMRKTQGDLYVDLSAIAKGHAVDRVAKVLDDLAVRNYFIEIGGEVRTKGTRHDGQPWQVGIERPTETEREIFCVIGLSDLSLATSGNYRNFYELDGKRYSHTIDPSTGYSAEHAIAAASVVADNCTLADAIATSMMVLGPERGIKAANENAWAVFLVYPSADDFETLASDRFSDLFPDVVPAGGLP